MVRIKLKESEIERKEISAASEKILFNTAVI